MRYRLIVGTTLLGFIAGTALFGFVVGAAMLSVVTIATTAQAYTPGVGSPGMSHGSSMSIHNSASSSLSDSGRRDTWNRPFDSDRGGATFDATGSNGSSKSGGHHAVPRRSGRLHKPHP